MVNANDSSWRLQRLLLVPSQHHQVYTWNRARCVLPEHMVPQQRSWLREVADRICLQDTKLEYRDALDIEEAVKMDLRREY
jgi:hypothetical protein